MEIAITGDHTDADQDIAFQHTDCLSPISQLPTELFVGIFQLALPEIPFLSDYAYIYSRSYVKKLYIMRSVTKRWQGIIEGTPSFWATVDSTVPSHVNEASILRSSGLPLSIIYRHQAFQNELESWPSPTEFLTLIAHTRPRWSTVALDLYDPTTFSDYLGAPLPLLQTIVVRGSIYQNRYTEPLELLGGDTTNLRFVALSGVSIRWRPGCFVQLECLKLKHMDRKILTGIHILDVLGASAGLRVLKLKGISIAIPPPSPIVTLHHLKHIKLHSCPIELVEWVLHQIHAPSCTKLVLNMDDEQIFDVPHLLDETLKPFHSPLRMMHKRLGESEIQLDSGGIRWHASDYRNREQGLSIYIEDFFDPFFLRWVDRILQDESGLQIIFEDGATSNEAVLRSLAPMRQVTKVVIRPNSQGVDVPAAVQFLSKPLSPTASLPCLPCLREIELPSWGWDTQDVLDMVQFRFHALSSEGMEETLLTINVDRPGFNWAISQRPILELAALVKMRETIGVKSVQLDGWKDPKGMLAVAWNEETSKPVWV